MKVLLIHSGNSVDGESARYTFVREQGEALHSIGCEVEYYAVSGKGMKGYLRNVKPLREKIKSYRPDIVHAHYGLCGMVAVLAASKVPVVITCHNGETLSFMANVVTSLAVQRAAFTICVAQHIYDKLYWKPKHYMIQPCGIDLQDLPLVDKTEAMEAMNLPQDRINILFGGAFSNDRKNAPLAKKALEIIGKERVSRRAINLIEMKGFNRQQVNWLLCGCDMLLLPTKSEGSPQVLKEAMACNCPVVATDVADVSFLLHGVTNSYATSFDPSDVADKIMRVIECGERTNGRLRIAELRLDNHQVAERIFNVYQSIINAYEY